jgi:hypothetical protein
MTVITQKINYMVEQLDVPEQNLVLEIIKRFLPDDIATEEDMTAILAARDEYARGECIGEDDIIWK